MDFAPILLVRRGSRQHRRHCEKLREICMVDTIYKVIELVGR